MFLKLTAKNTSYKVLINFDQVTSISGITTDSEMREVKLINENRIYVRESIEEIELMLKGVEPQKADPSSRDVIGSMGDSL